MACGPGPGPQKGGDNPELETLVPTLYFAMYDSVVAHSRLGLNVIVEGGLHGAFHPALPSDCAKRLAGLPVLFVGVHCPIETIMERRSASPPGSYAVGTSDDPVPAPVRLWQEEVHKPGIYDLEVDTSLLSPEECADAIGTRLSEGPPGTAFQRLAELRSA